MKRIKDFLVNLFRFNKELTKEEERIYLEKLLKKIKES